MQSQIHSRLQSGHEGLDTSSMSSLACNHMGGRALVLLSALHHGPRLRSRRSEIAISGSRDSSLGMRERGSRHLLDVEPRMQAYAEGRSCCGMPLTNGRRLQSRTHSRLQSRMPLQVRACVEWGAGCDARLAHLPWRRVCGSHSRSAALGRQAGPHSRPAH